MKCTVEKVYPDDFEKIYPLLLGHNNKKLDKSDWQQLFVRHWDCQEDYFGFKLLYQNELIGYLGIIFSERTIHGRKERIANRTSLIIKSRYRGKGLAKLLHDEIDKLSIHYTVVSTTGNEAVVKALKKRKYVDYETHERIIFPLPRMNPSSKGIQTISETQNIVKHLDKQNLIIFNDHLKFKCIFLLLLSDDGYSFLVFSRLRKKGIPVARLLYASNNQVFAYNSNRIVWKLFQTHGVCALMVHERIVENIRPVFSIRRRYPQPRVFKSSSLSRMDIDLIYSEYVLLNI